MLDDLFVKTFSLFRNAVNPLLLILQDQLFKTGGGDRIFSVWCSLLS